MFEDAEAYERFMGRWSRLVAPRLKQPVESYYERIKVKLDLNGMHELRHLAIHRSQKSTR